MAQLSVNDLTFYYEGSFEYIFEHVSFSIDTNWKIGFIGRNGKGKTTFLNLLMGKEEYYGSIKTSTAFDYFPYAIPKHKRTFSAIELVETWKPGCEEWKIFCELDKLMLDAEVLYRPFETLSPGERTKVMLAVLFSRENDFLLIDEPTNHLDGKSRETVKQYLSGKKGFLLVSHDRDLLDACVDHVLVLNRKTIEVQAGNFSSWWENKTRKDMFAQKENDKHKKEIKKLKKASERTRDWADKSENRKIGFDPVKEHERNISTRAYIGAKTKKMQSRVKQMEVRIGKEIEEKEGLLKDIEDTAKLKITPLRFHKDILVTARQYGLKYADGNEWIFENLSFQITQGDCIFLHGKNGSGKTSLIKAILKNVSEKQDNMAKNDIEEKGELFVSSGLVISYLSQDTSFLNGSLRDFCRERGIEESLLCALLRQMGMERAQFEKKLQDYSEGQKKKVLISSSLLTPAHLYIWDEPFNYIDVFSRIQIEDLLSQFHPTMLLVEHDARFREQVATKVIEL
ncbi:MAG: ABC-F type ribosomal protection protein [Lachnospiraceae bacterium]|nr:ABC-F type ribosomal protection protein [Lachnospiraceae bacterium]